MAASGTLRRPGRPGTQARSALGAQRRAPSAERVARGGDRARRMRRARSAHATGAERVARGGASCELACWRSQHTDTLGGFCLLAHNSNIVGDNRTGRVFPDHLITVGGLKTMSPAHLAVGPFLPPPCSLWQLKSPESRASPVVAPRPARPPPPRNAVSLDACEVLDP